MKSTDRNAKPRIAVLHAADEGPPPGLAPLADEAELIYASHQQALDAAIAQADILLVTDFRSSLVERAWPHAQALQWVHATSAGVDKLLFPRLRESDIPISNARGIFDRPIAEFVLGLILSYAKDLHGSRDLQREKSWRHRDTERIQGRRVLVVGAGAIGREIGRLTRAVGMHATGLASRAREDDPDFDAVYGADALHEHLPEADFVVVAAPLTQDTQGMFDREAFARMQSHARFINIARGPIVRTDDLVAALEAGEIAGAALDVFEQEPLPAEHPLWTLPQVLISPHMAGDVIGWREALSEQFIDNFRRWRKGEALLNVVDKQRGYVPAKK